ncbi:unnamed protein product, partial [Mesorhabditis spiculigera]
MNAYGVTCSMKSSSMAAAHRVVDLKEEKQLGKATAPRSPRQALFVRRMPSTTSSGSLFLTTRRNGWHAEANAESDASRLVAGDTAPVASRSFFLVKGG